MNEDSKVQAAAHRVVELEKEVEAAGQASVDAPSLARSHRLLHQWVDGVKGVVVNPALGRVTVIHEDGLTSSIASYGLAFLMSAPDRPDGAG